MQKNILVRNLRQPERDFWAAQKVIITALVPTVKNIRFSPELSTEKQMLINNMTMEKMVKCHAVYVTPFWREKGLSGTAFYLDEVVDPSVDNSCPGSVNGILASLIHAERAEFHLDKLLNITV